MSIYLNLIYKRAKKRGIHNQYIQADIRTIEFRPKSLDAILCSEVLEHLSKEEGYKLIKRMEEWGEKKIIITTPNGYIWQDNYDNNPLQEHKSGWSYEELRQLGFKVHGMNGWKKLRGYKGLVKYKPDYLWNKILHLTQLITYHYPNLAFQLFAIKELNNNEKQTGKFV